MSTKKKIYICSFIYVTISAIFVYLINQTNFHHKIYEKKLIYENQRLLNNYKIDNKPLKLQTKKVLLQRAKISKYKIFEKNYLLLMLNEYDNAINNKLSIEKKSNFVIITLKSQDQKNNEFLKQKINELITNETIELIDNIKAESFYTDIIQIEKKLNKLLTLIHYNIKNQYIKKPKKLDLNWDNNLFKISENINLEIDKLRSTIIDNNNMILKLLEIEDAKLFDLGFEMEKIFSKCLNDIGDHLNDNVLNEISKNTAFIKIFMLNTLCNYDLSINYDLSRILEEKIFSLNPSDIEIIKNKTFNEKKEQLKKIKINLKNLNELKIIEEKINESLFGFNLLLNIQRDFDNLIKEIKKSQSSLNNANEYDIEYFNLKHEKWEIITIFLILNFLLIYLFIYRQFEYLIKIIR